MEGLPGRPIQGDLKGIADSLTIQSAVDLLKQNRLDQSRSEAERRGIDLYGQNVAKGMLPSGALSAVYGGGGAVPQDIVTSVAGSAESINQGNILSGLTGINAQGATPSTVKTIADINAKKEELEISRDKADAYVKQVDALAQKYTAERNKEMREGYLSDEQMRRVDSVYNTFLKDTRVDGYIKGEAQFSQLQELILKPDASGAQALATVFAFMKSLDPESIVREGEQQQAKETGGVFDSIVGSINKWAGGGPLTPDVRRNILSVSQDAIQSSARTANRYRDEFVSRQQQIDPSVDPKLYVTSAFNPEIFKTFKTEEEAASAVKNGLIEKGEVFYVQTASGFAKGTGDKGDDN